MGHVSLDAIKQTAKVVKGLDFVQQSKPEHDEICPPCEKGRPIRFVNKTAVSRAYKACDCMYIDIFKITPRGINGENYGAIVMDEKHGAKWGYTFEKKSDAFKVVKNHNNLSTT